MDIQLNEEEIARLVAAKLLTDKAFIAQVAGTINAAPGGANTNSFWAGVKEQVSANVAREMTRWSRDVAKEETREAIRVMVKQVVNQEVGDVFRLVAGKMATKLAADAGMLFDELPKAEKKGAGVENILKKS